MTLRMDFGLSFFFTPSECVYFTRSTSQRVGHKLSSTSLR
jgi:hypothetical protein